MSYPDGGLKLELCEDWMIYARDNSNNLWFVITELWPEWSLYPESAWEEPDAIEKYMLSHALEDWENLDWRRAEYED